MLTLSVLFITGCGDTYQDTLQNEGVVANADLSQGADLYATKGCANCHGIDGGLEALGVSRVIVDITTERDVQNALYTLREAASGRDSRMIEQAKDLTSQEIVDLSTYIYFQRH